MEKDGSKYRRRTGERESDRDRRPRCVKENISQITKSEKREIEIKSYGKEENERRRESERMKLKQNKKETKAKDKN